MRAWIDRAGNMMHALRRRRDDDACMTGSRDQLLARQQARLSEIVRWASERSPFYRDLYGGPVSGPMDLASLPTVTKTQMMDAFDRFVTDERLRVDDLQRHLESIQGDEMFLDEFRVMTSSGSSGRKAIYVYDRAAWRAGLMPGILRVSRLCGLAPRLPRPRTCNVAAPDAKHMTFRGNASIDMGLFRTKRFSAATPLPELVAQLEAFMPEYIMGYPSAIAMLAEEQRAGRLHMRPKAVVTSSEVRTPAMTSAIREAWGLEPFNLLGLTESGLTAMDCSHHAGLHVFEDLCIVEAVDEHNRPVPHRTPGAKILVTNLFNRVQPIIRFEVSDLVTLDDTPCACGSPMIRITALDGRSDDLLELPGPRGTVRVHPIHVRGALAADSSVVQYQVTLGDDRLDVQVVLATSATSSTTAELERRLETALAAQSAAIPISVRAVPLIPREDGAGKLKLVRDARTRVPSPPA